MIWIFLLGLVIVFELIADVFSKEWSLRENPWLLFGSLGFYIVSNIFWLYTLKNGGGLSRSVVIFSVSTAIIATIIGYFFYKESVTTPQLFGIALGIISLGLILWNN